MFDKRYAANCRIYNMLASAPRHISFHTPGHKYGKWDITELSFSDNLSSPTGVLKRAQEDVSQILGAARSFILTDGSTCGILSLLRASGVKKLLFSACAHKSVYNGCKLLGIESVVLQNRYDGSIPQQLTAAEIEQTLLKSPCDGVLITSPDYYGNIAAYQEIKSVCARHGALLLCDGAHGGHLRGTPLYAGHYCDLWVDGVHKSLPACTQGAVVSAKTEMLAKRLEEAVDIFRTTSPNYVIMASVEYAVKYPSKPKVIREAERLKGALCAYENADWTKIVLSYGENAEKVCAFLESAGIFPEFCDGDNIMFYLSPATSLSSLKRLKTTLLPLEPLRVKLQSLHTMPAYIAGERTEYTEYSALEDCVGRTCAKNVGLFPPCIPVVSEGQRIEREHAEKLKNAKNTYGLTENKIKVYGNERKTD